MPFGDSCRSTAWFQTEPSGRFSIETWSKVWQLVQATVSHSVGLRDEINWITAIVGFCSISEGNYLGYMAVNEWNHWHKACHTPVR